MQLKKPARTSARQRLIAASCALLSAAARAGEQAPASTDQTDQRTIDAAIAYYHEDGRVTSVEPVVNLHWEDGEGSALNMNLTLDVLSGASPNGALASRQPQTFASPSGRSLTATPTTYTSASGQVTRSSSTVYTVAPGDLPKDPSYQDKRVAASAGWQKPLSRVTRLQYGGSLSWEHDFLSLGGNASLAHDFNQKNTTVALGANEEIDRINPVGGTPSAGTDYTLFQKGGNTSKSGTGVQLGVTQVMNRRWISEFNVSADRFHGYLNDPYKVLTILSSAGDTIGYLYEKRPDVRFRRSAYLENRVTGGRATGTLSLRYMSDDWGIRSRTAEATVKYWNGAHDRYLQPNVRWYQQTAAQFYMPWLPDSANRYIDSASADMRLAAFHAVTVGLKYGMRASLDSSTDFSVRLQYYHQFIDRRAVAPAALQGLNLYPGLKAMMLQTELRFDY